MTNLDEMSLKKPFGLKKYQEFSRKFHTVDNRDTEWRDSMDLGTAMGDHGFKFVGDGKYASVFVHTNYPYAIKVFMKDAAYLHYLNWAIRNQHNKYVPKIKGRVVKISNIIYAIRLEKLYDNGGRKHSELVHLLQDYEDVLDKYYDDSQYSIKIDDPDLISLCQFMKSHAKLVDMHYGNVMERADGSPVCVDPLYNWFKGGRFTIDPDDISHLKDIF